MRSGGSLHRHAQAGHQRPGRRSRPDDGCPARGTSRKPLPAIATQRPPAYGRRLEGQQEGHPDRREDPEHDRRAGDSGVWPRGVDPAGGHGRDRQSAHEDPLVAGEVRIAPPRAAGSEREGGDDRVAGEPDTPQPEGEPVQASVEIRRDDRHRLRRDRCQQRAAAKALCVPSAGSATAPARSHGRGGDAYRRPAAHTERQNVDRRARDPRGEHTGSGDDRERAQRADGVTELRGHLRRVCERTRCERHVHGKADREQREGEAAEALGGRVERHDAGRHHGRERGKGARRAHRPQVHAYRLRILPGAVAAGR